MENCMVEAVSKRMQIVFVFWFVMPPHQQWAFVLIMQINLHERRTWKFAISIILPTAKCARWALIKENEIIRM